MTPSTEETGLWGWGYVDSRGIKDGGYAEAINGSADLAEAKCAKRASPSSGTRLPRFCPGLSGDGCGRLLWVVYGQRRRAVCRFHLHAVPRPVPLARRTYTPSAPPLLRNPATGGCGPLVERGAAATLGNVYEPYLALTARLDVFQDRLMAGFTFAESACHIARAVLDECRHR